MNDGELARIAVCLEAEGWFHLGKRNPPRLGLCQSPRAARTSTDLGAPQRSPRLAGAGRIVGRMVRDSRPPRWQWTVGGSRDAVQPMEAIYPHMGQRRRARIDEPLDFAGRPRSLRVGEQPLGRGVRVAGLLAGAGAVSWISFQKGTYGPHPDPRVAGGGTDQDVIDVIEVLPVSTGVGQITGPYPRKPPRKTVRHWAVTTRGDAADPMEWADPSIGASGAGRGSMGSSTSSGGINPQVPGAAQEPPPGRRRVPATEPAPRELTMNEQTRKGRV